MSAFGVKADMTLAPQKSAFDPKRLYVNVFDVRAALCGLLHAVGNNCDFLHSERAG
jgi:hypothetical protein